MLTVPEHVHYARCDGGTAVLDLHQGRWHMFTGLGEQVWARVTQYGSITGLAEEIAVPAGLDAGTTRTSVDAYVATLIDMGLLAENRPQAPTCRQRWRRTRRARR
ncbi:hypothetical protein PUR49_03015 [Streptomyces sp. BE147]|uniref:hypothetical protein n=1 Tax=Streptomyces sp. BE147 TaxID=3002524 RepID=UPI002E77657B|nr:hypothetical protein [Streptomyces sp. BE147]MEE1735505.1 hypothetical protein [Streptomyces sp. BE147]